MAYPRQKHQRAQEAISVAGALRAKPVSHAAVGVHGGCPKRRDRYGQVRVKVDVLIPARWQEGSDLQKKDWQPRHVKIGNRNKGLKTKDRLTGPGCSPAPGLWGAA